MPFQALGSWVGGLFLVLGCLVAGPDGSLVPGHRLVGPDLGGSVSLVFCHMLWFERPEGQRVPEGQPDGLRPALVHAPVAFVGSRRDRQC